MLLPKSGVYHTPDSNLLSFLDLMRRKQSLYEEIQDYRMINKIKSLIEHYRSQEEKRLLHNMRTQQMKELA